MKKILAILLIGVLSINMVACSKGPQKETESSAIEDITGIDVEEFTGSDDSSSGGFLKNLHITFFNKPKVDLKRKTFFRWSDFGEKIPLPCKFSEFCEILKEHENISISDDLKQMKLSYRNDYRGEFSLMDENNDTSLHIVVAWLPYVEEDDEDKVVEDALDGTISILDSYIVEIKRGHSKQEKIIFPGNLYTGQELTKEEMIKLFGEPSDERIPTEEMLANPRTNYDLLEIYYYKYTGKNEFDYVYEIALYDGLVQRLTWSAS